MVMSTVTAKIHCDINTVWKTITSLTEYQWRSDIKKIEIVDDKTFVEYTKGGYPTTFVIMDFDEPKRYAFTIDNSNIKGHWLGILRDLGDKTEIEFTEDVTAKKSLLKPILKRYLRIQQKKYIRDLQKKLEV